MESFSQLQIAQDLGYVTEADIDAIRPQFISVAKMLSGLKFFSIITYQNNNPNRYHQSPITRIAKNAITHNLSPLTRNSKLVHNP